LGSIILAAILLKIGSFGLLLFYCSNYFINTNWFIYIKIKLIVGVWLNFSTIILQIDIKKLIAFYSIIHISILGYSMFSNYYIACKRVIIISISHAVVSNCLFYIRGVLYNIFISRNLFLIQGINIVITTIRWFILVYCLINLGIPGILSFFRELIVFKSLIFINNINIWLFLINILVIRFSTIILFTLISNGKCNVNVKIRFYNKEMLYRIYFRVIIIIFNLLF